METNLLDLLNPYLWAVNLRNFLYDRNVLKVCKLGIPVISVGNLSVGGTGKSSLVRYISEYLSKKFHVCILSRGYGRKTKGTLLVSYKGELKVGWEEAGDEPFMLAKVLKGVSVVVDEIRCRGGFYAVEKLRAEILILDDGFQHRRIYRDFDILLLKKEDLKDHLLPYGRLREPLSSLFRADAIVLSYQELNEWDIKLEKPVFKLYRKNWRILDGEGNPVHELKNLEVIAFAGLGDNEQFFKTLDNLGIKVIKKISFKDHYDYKDLKLSQDKLYITTLKDIVKLPSYKNVYYLDYSLDVPGLIELLENAIIRRHRAGSSAGRATDS
ncbi:MAG: tetraacyldisaccharide 4'-kinase [Hydrogenobacter sp.]